MSRIDTSEKTLCCGCGACAVICPTQCITMQADAEGFDYPHISEEDCINCGRCLSVCGMQSKPQFNKVQKSYAAWHKDAETRALGTSGSVFSALAKVVFSRGGVVAGARFSDDFKSVFHVVVESFENITALRGSKYVQSKTKDCFKEVQSNLKKGKETLFVGTPCQVSSLKRLVKSFNRSLLTCDLVCHGVPSPYVFRSYIESTERRIGSKISTYSFRNKSLGWNFPRIMIESENGKRVLSLPWCDKYFHAYSANISLRPCCYSCPFAKESREGDLTVADCWRVAASHPHYDDNKGTSLFLVNTDKGNFFLESLKDNDNLFLGEYDYRLAIKRNMPLTTASSLPTIRNVFFNKFTENGDFEKASEVYCSRKFTIQKRFAWIIKYLFWGILRKFQ